MLFSKLLLVLLWCAAVASAVMITYPANAAIEVGGSVTFRFRNSGNQPPDWNFAKTKASSNEIKIARYCTVSGSHEAYYSTDGVGGECNLSIRHATLDQGGLYSCNSVFDRVIALLTVVDMTLSISGTSEVAEGDRLNVSCLVRRSTTEAPLQPLNLRWNDAAGSNITSSSHGNTLLSTAIVTVRRSPLPSYTCSVSFGPLINIPDDYGGIHATNVPYAVFSKSTEVIDVQYCPSVPVVSYSDNRLGCQADANPPATYSWVDQANGNSYSGAEITATHSGTYTCNATTTIRGRVCYNTVDYIISDTAAASARLWWVGLLVALLILAGGAIVLVYFLHARMCKKPLPPPHPPPPQPPPPPPPTSSTSSTSSTRRSSEHSPQTNGEDTASKPSRIPN